MQRATVSLPWVNISDVSPELGQKIRTLTLILIHPVLQSKHYLCSFPPSPFLLCGVCWLFIAAGGMVFGLLSADCLQTNKSFEGRLTLSHASYWKRYVVTASTGWTGVGRLDLRCTLKVCLTVTKRLVFNGIRNSASSTDSFHCQTLDVQLQLARWGLHDRQR